MATSVIPLRPKDFVSNLTQDEQAALTWYILSGCSKKTAFVTFARPDMLPSKAKAAVDSYVQQFFAQKESIDYLNAYRQTIDTFLNPPAKKKQGAQESLDERKVKSKTKLVEFALELVDHIETADDPEAVMKMADKLGLLDSDEDQAEEPRRYLPTQCGECAYRKFCEEHTEDMCPSCKYFQFGEDNGIHFAKEEMLNIKQDE